MKNKILASMAGLLLASAAAAQAQAVMTIAQWNFENSPVTNSAPNPAPSLNNCVGQISVAAFGLDQFAAPTLGTNGPDITQGAASDTSTAAKGGDGITNLSQIWRVRAQNPAGTANGWSSQAAIGTQGAQFNVDTTGFTNIQVAFDWYLTKQGEANLQFEYTVDGINWSNGVPVVIPAPQLSGGFATLVNNTAGSDGNSVQGYYVQSGPGASNPGGQQWFTNLVVAVTNPAAANNPNFGIRFANASTGASCVSGLGAALNNTSGNWRFDNITFSGTSSGTVLTPPTITTSTSATVDGPFTNTYAVNNNWSNNITGIKVNGTTLPATAYKFIGASPIQIVYSPTNSALLRTVGTLNIAIAANGYALDTYSQYIGPGQPKQLLVTTQPGGPVGNGGTLVVQPVLEVVDIYTNIATNCSATYTATPSAGWGFGPGSGTMIPMTAGVVTFTNLSATNMALVANATITFTASGATGLGALPFTTTNSAVFTNPAPRTTGFTPGNLAVLQADAVVGTVANNNTTFSIIELSPTIANQAAPVNVYPISATGSNALRQSDAATTGRLATSGDGTLLCFAAAEDGNSTTPDEVAINTRGVGTIDAHGNFTLQTSYIGDGSVSGNQARSATTLDNTNYVIGDKGGVYTNGMTQPWIGGSAANIRSLKAFGGNVYGLQQASSSVTAVLLQIIPDPDGDIYFDGTFVENTSSYYPVQDFQQDAAVLDFYMVRSGHNGSLYDVVYYIDGTNSTSGAIFKYCYSGNYDADTGLVPEYVPAGMVNTANGGDGLCAATNAAGGFDLYYTTGKGGLASNSVVMVHDSSAWNGTLSLSAPTVLYTAPAQSSLKGMAFAPLAAPAAATVVTLAAANLTPGSALLPASVSPNGLLTTNLFYCNTNLSAPASFYNVGSATVPAGWNPVTVSQTVAGLAPGQAYSFYASATNSVGGSIGATVAFTTAVNLGTVRVDGGKLKFNFTAATGTASSWTIWGSTNVATPYNLWLNLGHPSEVSPGSYQFGDSNGATNQAVFYRVTNP